MRVVDIDLRDTYALRLAVLRDNTPTTNVRFAEDQWPGVFHLGIRDEDGQLIAISSWVPRDLEVMHEMRGLQLRGMATVRVMQGSGAGGMLVVAGVQRAEHLGFDLVWANARDTALAFYAHHRFVAIGDGFVEQATQLAHHVVMRNLHD